MGKGFAYIGNEHVIEMKIGKFKTKYAAHRLKGNALLCLSSLFFFTYP